MKKPDSKQLARFGAIFVALVTLGWFIWLFVSGRAHGFGQALASAHLLWVLAGAGAFVGFFMLDALCYRITGTMTGVRMGFADLMSIAAAGIFFGYLTPGQVGASPAQIVRLSKAGLSVGDASAIQLIRFFIYQLAVTVFGMAMLILKLPYFVARFGDITLIAAAALLVHLAIMAMLVGLIFFPTIIRRLGNIGIRIFSTRPRLIKDPGAARQGLEKQLEEYAHSVRAATHHKGVVISAVVITIVQLGCIYTIPHCVLMAFGTPGDGLLTNVAAAAFVQLILTAVPLPGGTGGAEGGFTLFFAPVLGSTVTTALVIWRVITFYLPVLLSMPLLALKSAVTPSEREQLFGTAKVGREALHEDITGVRRTAVEIHSFKEHKKQLAREQRRLRRQKRRLGLSIARLKERLASWRGGRKS